MRFVVTTRASAHEAEHTVEWRPVRPVAITSRSAEAVRWAAQLESTGGVGGKLTLGVSGEWWFDASAKLNVTLTNAGASPVEVRQSE